MFINCNCNLYHIECVTTDPVGAPQSERGRGKRVYDRQACVRNKGCVLVGCRPASVALLAGAWHHEQLGAPIHQSLQRSRRPYVAQCLLRRRHSTRHPASRRRCLRPPSHLPPRPHLCITKGNSAHAFLDVRTKPLHPPRPQTALWRRCSAALLLPSANPQRGPRLSVVCPPRPGRPPSQPSEAMGSCPHATCPVATAEISYVVQESYRNANEVWRHRSLVNKSNDPCFTATALWHDEVDELLENTKIAWLSVYLAIFVKPDNSAAGRARQYSRGTYYDVTEPECS